MTGNVIQARGIKGGDWLILGRLMGVQASTYNLVALQQSNVTSITRYLVDLNDGETVLATTVLVVSTHILNALSTGTVWEIDTVGFNFIDQIPGDLLENLPGVEVQYVIVLSDTAETIIKQHVDINLKPSN